MQNAGLDESQAGINIASRNINNLRCKDEQKIHRCIKPYRDSKSIFLALQF